VPQHSLLRMKSPPESVHTRRTPSSEMRKPEIWATPAESGAADLDQDFGVDAADFEDRNTAARLRRYAGSPDFKRSSGSQRGSVRGARSGRPTS
jgi:hypothetical protein